MGTAPLSHDAAIDALARCAQTVTVLSYQEAIEGYFKLRGLSIPPDGWRDLAEAPTDGRQLRLLVDYSGEDADHALDDTADFAATIGFWQENDEPTGGEWLFAGWCWSHDHYTQGRGRVIGWLPWENPPAAPDAEAS